MNAQQSTPSDTTTINDSSRTLFAAAALIAVGGIGIGLGTVASAGTETDPTTDDRIESSYRAAPADTEAPVNADTATTQPAVVTEPNTPPATLPITTTATAVETASTPAPLARVIPEALRGTWHEVDGAPITADDCRPELPVNFGQILTISESGFVVFESGGELIEVHEVGSLRIEATFDTTYGDTPIQDRITFDAPGDGDVVIMSGDGRPGPTQYVRCPA